MENDIIKGIDREMKRTTNLLDFLIIQPGYLEGMIPLKKEKIMVENLIRIKCSLLWSERMIEEIESKMEKESINAVNELFKMIEVNKN